MRQPGQVTITFGNVAVAKLLVVLLTGIVGGYFFAQSEARDRQRGQTLTLEQYTADFERYKTELLDSVELPAAILGITFIAAGFFGIYELLAYLIGRLAARLGGPGPPPEKPPARPW